MNWYGRAGKYSDRIEYAMRMNEYITLGRSGLRVSPLCLGTMTFGTEWGWGAEENVSRQLLDRYLEAGGNFIDTADARNRSLEKQKCS